MMVLCMVTQRSEFAFEGEELIYGIRLGDYGSTLVVCDRLWEVYILAGGSAGRTLVRI